MRMSITYASAGRLLSAVTKYYLQIQNLRYQPLGPPFSLLTTDYLTDFNYLMTVDPRDYTLQITVT
jgi:hypothetical protein